MSSRRIPTITQLSHSEALDWVQTSASTLIVTGSGLSVSPPASMPNVGVFLGRVAGLLEQASGYAAPRSNAAMGDDYRNRLFPEVMYGAIAEAYETRSHLEMWRALDGSNAEQAGSRPNAGHLAVAALAGQRRWPIATTNFDCQIEAAAAKLGYQLATYLLRGNEPLTIDGAPGVVQLVKVHGTAEDPTTIRSMASDLSRSYRSIKQIQFSPVPERALVIGYSGRDFDLFPWLVETFPGTHVLWVDPALDERHRASALPGLLAYQGSWEDLAMALLAEFGIGGLPLATTRTITYDEIIDELVNTHCRTVIDEGGRERAVAAMLGVLVACGANRQACSLAEYHLAEYDLASGTQRSDERPARIQTLLWASGASSSVDRFTAGLAYARQALDEARAFGTRRERGRAAIAVAYAKVSARWLRVPGVPIANVSRGARLWSLCAPIWVAAYYTPDAVRGHRELTRSLGNEFDPRTYRFVSDYLEHLIRLMAFADKLRRRVLPEQLVRAAWRRLSSACSDAGYTLGVFNTSKYTTRDTGAYGGPVAAMASSLVMGDLVGQAIAHRDAGLGFLDSSESEDSEDPTGDKETAEFYFAEALSLAQTLGCPSLQLKCLVPMREADLIPPLAPGMVGQLLDSSEAVMLRSQHAALTRILEGS